MTQQNREAVRDQLATLLNAKLVAADSIVQAVYNYRTSDFAGLSPVVIVSSGGSNRELISGMPQPGVRNAVFLLTVHVFVRYAATDWTEAQAEDRLDLIERTIVGVLDDNARVTDVWNAIDYQADSVRDDLEIGGKMYIRETIPIGVEGLYG